jgi:glycosyltransferase involved in cell wall biosynthesis
MRIAFCWTNGVRNKDVFNHWNDGLRAAMKLIEAEHEVTYHEPYEDLPTVDWILFWEAPCTFASGEWGAAYKKVMSSPQKKALCFAGGPIKPEWVEGFNHIFVESKINKDEFDALGIKNSTAFGVNTDVFKPMNEDKTHTTVTHGTCAGWKRQNLVCQAFGERALVFGRPQETDMYPFNECTKCNSTVLLEQSYEETARLINTGEVAVNCADFWGGGQRQTLEAMACNLDVVVMSDSPKNREYVEESSAGIIVNPDPDSIKRGVFALQPNKRKRGRDYVLSKWTHHHYKEALLNALT